MAAAPFLIPTNGAQLSIVLMSSPSYEVFSLGPSPTLQLSSSLKMSSLSAPGWSQSSIPRKGSQFLSRGFLEDPISRTVSI